MLPTVVVIGFGISACLRWYTLFISASRGRSCGVSVRRLLVGIQSFPRADLQRLEQIRGITELRSRIVMPVTIDLEGVDKPLSGTIYSMPADPRRVINNLVLRQGGYFTNLRREEVILGDAFARARSIRPGDKIHVLLNDRRQELYVVGTAISAEFVFARAPGAMIPDKAGYAILFLKERFAEEATDLEGASNQIVGLLTPEFQDRPETVLEELNSQLERYGEAVSTKLADQESHLQLMSDIKGLRTVNLIVPSVFLAVARADLGRADGASDTAAADRGRNAEGDGLQ